MEAAEKGGYPHFMLKEINEQPAAITATVSPRVEDGLPGAPHPGADRRECCAVSGPGPPGGLRHGHARRYGGQICHRSGWPVCPAEVDIASEFRYRDPILDPDDLVIIISQSGETSDTLAALQPRQEPGRAGAGYRQCGGQLHRTCARITSSTPTPARRSRWRPPRPIWCSCAPSTSLRCRLAYAQRTAERGRDPPPDGRAAARAGEVIQPRLGRL